MNPRINKGIRLKKVFPRVLPRPLVACTLAVILTAAAYSTATLGDDIKVKLSGDHEVPAGANGPVAVPLAKKGDNGWSVPPGAKLSDAQYQSYKAGELYVNVHSAADPDGEIRGQLKP